MGPPTEIGGICNITGKCVPSATTGLLSIQIVELGDNTRCVDVSSKVG